ncbi:MAG: YncE family protein [Chryseobacterium sp.]|nr:YncE family protein [Chryseobacterium sp.]
MIKKIIYLLFSVFVLFLNSCREDYDYIEYGPQASGVQEPEDLSVKGLYILNEGNMGSNKASLDYFDYSTGVFTKNYYAGQNPTVVNSLGDVGNDVKVYRDKLFAVINLSNYVEVMDAKTAKHIGEIPVTNCRYINFHGNYAYITSYGGAVGQSQPGYVVKVDVNTLKIVDKVFVGLQPDELEVVGDKLYVANSGGYSYPNYDNTVSVVDLNTFKETKKITVAINLNKIRKDDNGKLWVTSRGNYMDIPPKAYVLDPNTDTVIKEINQPISDMGFVENRMYYYGYQWTSSGTVSSYGIIDTDTYQTLSNQFIQDGNEKKIVIPYGIAVNPDNGDIFIADAKDYISNGEVFCFTKYGKLKWRATTGDIPGHFAFLFK